MHAVTFALDVNHVMSQ